MRKLALLLVLAGCTRHNGGNTPVVCTPGEQRQCACVGGAIGVQLCNPLGTSLGDCIGCPGSDLSGQELRDLSVVALPDLSQPQDLAGADLAGVDLAGADLTASADDLSAAVEDMAVPPDLSVPIDLAGADFALPTACPTVMLVLDTSGSMDANIFAGTNTSHFAASQQAMDFVVNNYGAFMPLGYTHFDNGDGVCTDGVVVSPEPKTNNASLLKNDIDGTVVVAPSNVGNMGNAVGDIAADPNMHQSQRRGSFMIILTDGAGNCEATDPTFTVNAVNTAARASQPVKTYIVALEPQSMVDSDEQGMTALANAGQAQCSGAYCDGHVYWPAVDVAHTTKTLDLILNQIVHTVPGGCSGFACFPSGAACGAGATCCGTVGCKNLTNDAENCGACGVSCGAGGTCSGSLCHCGSMTCPQGDHCCSGACCSSLDMAPPPPCVCNPACVFGSCVAANCCTDVGGCSATPNLCSCVPGPFGTCN
jgi:hypothetical protein